MTQTVLICMLLLAPPASAESPLTFERIHISDTAYEAACAFDVDKDGHIDIISGAYWHAGPDYTAKHKITDVPANGEYFDDFGDYPVDVNGDGYTDILTGGWWSKRLYWLENPQGKPVEWERHPISRAGSIERVAVYDLDGDGYVEFIPNETKSLTIHQLIRGDSGKGTAKFKKYTVHDKAQGHGLGFGDLNADGCVDIILFNGWYEAPKSGLDGRWRFHREFDLGSASIPILTHDVNGDGRLDLIVGHAHGYGLYWWEQGKEEGGKRTWIKHTIDETRSQYHDLALADIDNDGALEVVTGKRYRAHNGNDPGSTDPVGVYYFEINGGDFACVTLDYGPPETSSGIGIYCWVEDLDGNGWLDIVAPGKEGLYLFKNQGKAKALD